MFHHIFAVALFLFSTLISGKRSLFDGTDLPRLKDTDSIELYHLRSFSTLDLDTDAGMFSIQSSGLALRSTTTDNVMVLQYRPKNFSSSFFPKVLTSEDSSFWTGLSWDKRAEIVYFDHIDTSFWQQSTFLARINGVVYKNYVKWLEQYIQYHPVFRPQSICSNKFDIDACFVIEDTWDTFLADSLHLFAALSVRINAIIPPRATELKFIAAKEPRLVRVTNISNEYFSDYGSNSEQPNDSGDGTKRMRLPAERYLAESNDNPTGEKFNQWNLLSASYLQDVNEGGESTSRTNTSSSTPHINSNDSSSDAPTSYPTHVPTTALTPSSSSYSSSPSMTPSLFSPPTSSPTLAASSAPPSLFPTSFPSVGLEYSPPDNDDIPSVHADDVLKYYDKLLTCLQEYQMKDYTLSLISCAAEDVAYIHFERDLYWEVTPRYPFIFLHDYLQEIPPPQYRSNPGVDAVDWSLVGFFVVSIVLGCCATMYQIKIWELAMQCFCRCCPGCFIASWGGYEDTALTHGIECDNRTGQDVAGTTESKKMSKTSMSRLWGVFINYRGRGNQPPLVRKSLPEQFHYAKLNQTDDDEEQQNDTPVEIEMSEQKPYVHL